MTQINTKQRIILVTGPSGAGRSTTINVLEDLGYEVIDNLPLSLLDRLLAGPPPERPLALGLDVRNRDFSVDTLIRTMDNLAGNAAVDVATLFIDCSEDVLIRRYSETRRKHPLARDEEPLSGIRREKDLLVPIMARAEMLIDSTFLSPHDLRAEVEALVVPNGSRQMVVTVQSFSYKRGLPRGADIVLDCRFLRNPHWNPDLRALDGRDERVRDYVAMDEKFGPFLHQLIPMLQFLLPAYKAEGKSSLSIAFGCTGGQHRSVAMAEVIANSLAEQDWQVSKRHRELERRANLSGDTQQGLRL